MKISRRTLLRAIPPLALAACGASKFSASGIQFGVPSNPPWPSGYTRRMNMLVGKQGAIQAGDIIDVTVNLDSLIAADKLIPLYEDFVLAYLQPNGTWVFLDSHIVDSSTVRFRAVANIASGKSDHNYYIYYNWRNIGIEYMLAQKIDTFTFVDLPENPIWDHSADAANTWPWMGECDMVYDSVTKKFHIFASSRPEKDWQYTQFGGIKHIVSPARSIKGPYSPHPTYPITMQGPVGSPTGCEYDGAGAPKLFQMNGEWWMYCSGQNYLGTPPSKFGNYLYRFPDGLDGAAVRDSANPIFADMPASDYHVVMEPFLMNGYVYAYTNGPNAGLMEKRAFRSSNGKTGWTDLGLILPTGHFEVCALLVHQNRVYFFTGENNSGGTFNPFKCSLYRSNVGDPLTLTLIRDRNVFNYQDDTWNHGADSNSPGMIAGASHGGHFGLVYSGWPGAYANQDNANAPKRLGIALAERPFKTTLGGAAHSLTPVFGNEESA